MSASLHVNIIINLTEHCIMKKQYMKPQTIVVQLRSKSTLLTSSNYEDNHVVMKGDSGGIKFDIGDLEGGDGEDAASRRSTNLWDDFEEEEW